MRRLLASLIACLLPTILVRQLLLLLGYRISKGVRIGFSWIDSPKVDLRTGSRIGHLNLIRCSRLSMMPHSLIGHGNMILGPFAMLLDERAAIGNRNRVRRAPQGAVAVGYSVLRLGELAKVTGGHYIDCTCSVRLDKFSVLAGADSQVWTHGYVHDREGEGRYRIDGRVSIGSNVYIGSRCVITAGVQIANGAIVGAGTTVARDLPNASLYVSGPLRELPRPALPELRSDLRLQDLPALVETVYSKNK